MPKLLLQYSHFQKDFFPLTFTRPFTDLRVGILSVADKWLKIANQQGIELELILEEDVNRADKIWSANFIPTPSIDLSTFFNQPAAATNDFIELNSPWDLVRHNTRFMMDDFELLRGTYGNAAIRENIYVSGAFPLFLHPSVSTEHCFINTADGPVMIDENATIMQGAMLRGPLYIGKRSTVKMGATLYAGSNIGNDCIVGGEIKNTVFQAFSNKGHHGYIGDSFIGEWCNFGAGTSCSNLKNTAGELKAWAISDDSFQPIGKKAGMLTGDHVKTAINTSFNSGSVVAGFSNIFSNTSLLPKFIPPFQWGIEEEKVYDFEKMLEEIERWMQMKGQKPTEKQIQDIKSLYKQTKLT